MVAEIETRLSRPNGPYTTSYSAERLAPVLALIAKGVSPSGAAKKCGISKQALSDWRREHPDVEPAIEQAEGEHEAYLADMLRACKTKWGTPDPKALEIEARRYPQYQLHESSESVTLAVTVAMTHAQVAALHAYHCATLQPVSESVTLPLELSESGHGGEANP